jgi:hypothetical protein
MGTPSSLGDLGYGVTAVFPLSTSTAIFHIRTSDTGTVATTSRAFDLSRALHYGTTGGKPLDATLHRRGSVPRWKSVSVILPLEATFHTSGVNAFITVAHKHRAATSGAGSTWATLRSQVFRLKAGTDTDATFHTGVVSSANLMAVGRYYKANVTFSYKKASSTAAKDTTTNTEIVVNSPIVMFSGGDTPQASVPLLVS